MSFVGLNTGYTGLVSAQIGLDTASHNIANTNTEGYTRQRIDQVTRRPLSRAEGFIGQGVEVTDVRRARDAFLDARYRAGAVVLGSMVANADLLQRAEASLGEPDDGLTIVLDEMFDAFEELSNTPDDESARVTVLRTLERFADRTRVLDEDLSTLEADTVENLGFMVDEANQLVAQVAELSDQIAEAATSGHTPNDLLDQRDRLLDQLSAQLGVTVIDQGNYALRVSIDGMALVDGSTPHRLSLNSNYELVHDTGLVVDVAGEIGGTQQFLTTDLPALTTRFNDFVAEVVANVNAQHAAGFSGPGASGTDLFSVTLGDEASTIASLITDPALLAASATDGTPFPVFDGDNARAMADLRDALVANGGTDTLGGSLRTVVTELGATVATARRAADAQDELVAAADLARAAQHGVNLDEEMVLLLQYQRSYQAASRVITTVDATLDTLINRTGLVGR